jgi:hypothetical protein
MPAIVQLPDRRWTLSHCPAGCGAPLPARVGIHATRAGYCSQCNATWYSKNMRLNAERLYQTQLGIPAQPHRLPPFVVGAYPVVVRPRAKRPSEMTDAELVAELTPTDRLAPSFVVACDPCAPQDHSYTPDKHLKHCACPECVGAAMKARGIRL